MQDARLKALGEEIEAGGRISADLAPRLAEALRGVGLPLAARFDSFDAVLGLVDAALPGWAISLDGTASTGHGDWTCTLRRSRARDNDEAIGVGRNGESPASALLAALLKALATGARP